MFEGFNYREKFDEKISPKFMISSLIRFSINNVFIICPSIAVLVRTPYIRNVTLAKKKKKNTNEKLKMPSKRYIKC